MPCTHEIPGGSDVVFYDQLPLWIRSLRQTAGTALSIRLVPTQIESRGVKPVLVPATLRAVREETIDTPAGRSEALRWELSAGGTTPDVYWLSRTAPYLLVA